MSRRAGDPGKPNSQAHAAATARIGGDDAAVAAERPILDRQERLQIYRHAGMGRDRTRGRDLGRRRVSHAYQTLDAEAYRDLALGNVQLPEQSGAELATVESNPKASGACARCHGDKAQLPLSNLVPVLHGQPADYLLASLKAYAEGKRRSGIMQPLAADLRPEDMRELADYYAGLPPPQLQSKNSDAALVERGRKLAVEGRSHAGVLPCATCHNNVGHYPRLEGQYAAYMAGQLRLWKAGIGPSTDVGATMMAIAQKLSDEDIKAVTSYFETLPRE